MGGGGARGEATVGHRGENLKHLWMILGKGPSPEAHHLRDAVLLPGSHGHPTSLVKCGQKWLVCSTCPLRKIGFPGACVCGEGRGVDPQIICLVVACALGRGSKRVGGSKPQCSQNEIQTTEHAQPVYLPSQQPTPIFKHTLLVTKRLQNFWTPSSRPDLSVGKAPPPHLSFNSRVVLLRRSQWPP